MMTMLVVIVIVMTVSESAMITLTWIDVILHAVVEMAANNNIVPYLTLNSNSNRNNDNLLAAPTLHRIYQSNIATKSIHMPNSIPSLQLSRNPHPKTRIHAVMTQ